MRWSSRLVQAANCNIFCRRAAPGDKPELCELQAKGTILIELGHLATEMEDADRAKLLHVGMTRARHRLILTASSDNGITERLAEIAA
jgi:ATP-dependent exoDNAse (exonuclease V) beta subunit